MQNFRTVQVLLRVMYTFLNLHRYKEFKNQKNYHVKKLKKKV